MKEYFKIAWRNIWRNKRRTFITLTSVLFAVFLALIMRSMQLGTYGFMVESAVKNSTGYIQVHEKGYWSDKSIDNTMLTSPELEKRIRKTENVSQVISRLESFALASYGKQTKGVFITGTVPEIEDSISGLSKRLVRGTYLQSGANGILVSEGLANFLKADVNDTVVLLGQGYHGQTAAVALPVRGIVQFVQPDMNNGMIFMDLSQVQSFYSSPDRLTSISIMLHNPDKMNRTAGLLSAMDPDKLEVMTWKEMLVELVQYIDSDNISGLFMLGILYMVVGFGIFGTILMMTMERRKEFGIMVAVGMRRYKLSIIIFLETMIIGITGVLSGIATSIPFILYFHEHPIRLTGETAKAILEYNMEPIMPFALEPGYFLNQGLVVIIITLLAVIYPFSVINRFKVVSAIKGR
jgi:ABC-type lipoprotein release transport system permease subunit